MVVITVAILAEYRKNSIQKTGKNREKRNIVCYTVQDIKKKQEEKDMLFEPSYIKDFHCTASACQDTCCAGWEIVLDEEAQKRYREVKGAFGKRLNQAIQTEDGEAYFALTKEKRCPFLNREGLCDIFLELGEEALCDICTEHPRFYNWIGDYTEKGLGLCCEEAERLLFAHKEPLEFVCTEGEAGEAISEDLKALLQIRQEAFGILQDRTLSFKERIAEFKAFMQQVQLVLDGAETEAAESSETECAETVFDPDDGKGMPVLFPSPEKIRAILDFYHTLDFLDPAWKGLVLQAEKDADRIAENGEALLAADTDRVYEWEHVAVYLLFRYSCEAVYDGDLMTRAEFVCHSLELLSILAAEMALSDGYTTEKRDHLLRMFSREIEYCPENMEAVCEAVRNGQFTDVL